MSENEGGFATSHVFPGKTNAMVKTIMGQMGIDDPNEAVRRINSGEWIVAPEPNKIRAKFPTFLKFKLYQIETLERVRQDIGSTRRISADFYNFIMSNDFEGPEIDMEIELVAVKSSQLGFQGDVPHNELLNVANHYGLEICPQVTALSLYFRESAKLQELGLKLGLNSACVVSKPIGSVIFSILLRQFHFPELVLARNLERPVAWRKDVDVFIFKRKNL